LIGHSPTPGYFIDKKNVTELFKTEYNNVCCVEQNPLWPICINGEDEYSRSETIQLFSDKYHYLKGNCCNIEEWDFNKKNTISISKTKVCQEPPLSIIAYDDSNLKIKKG
jgi:hypothetical protein